MSERQTPVGEPPGDIGTDADTIDESVAELPPTAQFVRIVGGSHSFFGDYGLQDGDGTPTISRDEAQAEIAAASIEFLDSIDTDFAN